MKQSTKRKEGKQEMTVVKGGKQIPFKRINQKTRNEKGEIVDVEVTTGTIINMILSYDPSKVDPAEYGNWGITMSEMIERRAIRKAVTEVHKDSTVITLTDEQCKILYDMCSIIKWKGEDDFIMEFWESLK